MVEIGVIADDLTGANDTGVQFSKQGLRTIVLTRVESLKDMPRNIDVIVIDTESRALPSSLAYDRVKIAAEKLVEAKVPIIYKKIDSTLKGNIGSELDGVMDVTGIKTAIVAPAFPANKRITVGGYQLVNQVPLSKTEAAFDPVTPVRESHVPTLIARQSRRKVGYVGLASVMELQSLVENLRDCVQRGEEIIILDSITQGDLKRIAQAAVKLNLHRLTCGPAGLAEELPQAMGLISGKPVVVISGSVSEVTMRQIAHAEGAGCIVVEVDTAKVIRGQRIQEVHRVVNETKRIVSQGFDVIISSARTKEAVSGDLKIGESLGMTSVEVSNIIGLVLGEIASEVSAIGGVSGIFLTGGTTANRALEVMGAYGTEVDDEVSPGIPSSIIVGGRCSGLRIVTKAGGFGDEDAIMKWIRYLKMKGGK
ncbi:four-carbon acid sugar kinase family protein [Candidatus Bathyarchaeota archaeon]|nr:four-carbon acid sugar kinase family protein [Candidatus Bathyarchaeota archaeon]